MIKPGTGLENEMLLLCYLKCDILMKKVKK